MGWRAAFIALTSALLCAAPASAATLTVTTSDDPGGSCTVTTCTTLRAAITEANRLAGTDTITVPAGVINAADDFVISTAVQIVGASARTTIIDGGAKYRGFRVLTGASLALSRITIRDGAAGGGDSTDGGGIYNQGLLVLQDVRVTASRASRGGGIANNLGRIQGDNVLVDNNSATGAGGAGGIQNTAGPEIAGQQGWLVLTDATIFKNTSTGSGAVGGLFSTGTGAVIGLTRSTVADNVGGAIRGVGGIVVSGNTQAFGSLIARNLAGGVTVNCGDVKPTDGNFNVEDDTDCALAPGGMKPGLATALTNEGGQLDVLTIAQSGDAFNRMPFGDTPCEGTDQRGVSRPQSAACDAGAFELVVPPFVTVTSGPNGTVTGSQVEFNFQADRTGVTVQCDLTGPGQTAGYETCYKENAQPYTGLADGPYTFSVRAVNTQYPDAPATTRTFVVNTAAPNTTITAGPSGLVNDATPTFSFTASEPGSTFECALDSTAANAWSACTSPHTTATLTQGAHTIFVRAIDAAGSVDATPASRAFTVDTVAPDTTMGSGPTGPTASTSATFTFTSNDAGATFQCALDGAAFAACPVSYTGLSQGAHTFQVRAVDAAGNMDASPDSRTWTVDTVAPAAPVITAPTENQLLNVGTINVNGTAEPNATVQLTEGATGQGSSPVSGTGTWNVILAPVSDGTHTYTARTTDAAGNQSAATNRTIRVDKTLPETTIVSGPSGPTNDTTPTWTFSSNESPVTFECALDGATHTACPNPFTPTLTPGAHTLSVRAVDQAGNRDNTPATRSVNIDPTAPDPPVVLQPAESQWVTTTSMTVSGTAPVGTTVEVREGQVSRGTVTTTAAGTWALPPVVITDGQHTFEITARNALGTPSSAITRTFRVDTIAPSAPTLENAAAGGSTVTLSGKSEAGATVEILEGATVVGSATADSSAGWTLALANVPDGSHTYTARARDAAGNRSGASAPRAVTVDTAPPPAPEVQGPSGATTDPNPTFSFASAEPTVECRLDTPAGPGSYEVCISPKSFSALAPGAVRVLRARHRAVGPPDGDAAPVHGHAAPARADAHAHPDRRPAADAGAEPDDRRHAREGGHGAREGEGRLEVRAARRHQGHQERLRG